ncbi:MAG: orotidine-5'-phosphate decarboxylase [Paracoccaceae bacterium]|tara:strand:+ start:177 stop:872 length:696 start_codon:yes stop_codon:yes gene_type:complete
MKNLEEKLIVALDNKEILQNKTLVSSLENKVSFFKIGLRTFVINGFDLVDEIKKKGKRVFLDLKLYDIKSTIQETVARISEHRIDFLTVNGDPSVVEAAFNGRKDEKMKILAVTFLTNQNRNDLDLSLIKDGNINELVAERANNAFMAGADGIICSPLEANLIRSKNHFSNKIIVTPGIRLNYSGNEDQKRVSTPSEALRAGADYIVVGRPIWDANDPVLAVNEIFNNMYN